MSKLLSLALAAVAAFAMVSTSTPVFAAEAGAHYRTASVTYGDLNLATAEGIKALKGRVRAAAREVCVDKGPAGRDYRMEATCRSVAMADARPEVERVVAGHRPQVILASRR